MALSNMGQCGEGDLGGAKVKQKGNFVPTRKNDRTSSVDKIELSVPSRGLSSPAGRAGMGTREEPLRQRFCRGTNCGVVFWDLPSL